MSQSAPRERRTIHFRGRVQGVGFRYSTRQIAAGFSVSGYVENLSDGAVLLVVEGLPAELDRFLAQLETTMGRYIEGTNVDTSPASGEFPGFQIRH